MRQPRAQPAARRPVEGVSDGNTAVCLPRLAPATRTRKHLHLVGRGRVEIHGMVTPVP